METHEQRSTHQYRIENVSDRAPFNAARGCSQDDFITTKTTATPTTNRNIHNNDDSKARTTAAAAAQDLTTKTVSRHSFTPTESLSVARATANRLSSPVRSSSPPKYWLLPLIQTGTKKCESGGGGKHQ